MPIEKNGLPDDFNRIVEQFHDVAKKLSHAKGPDERRELLRVMRLLLLEADEKVERDIVPQWTKNPQRIAGIIPSSS